MRALNHRECGILEAADLLLGHSMFGIDSDTKVRWLDVRMVRNKRVKPQNIVSNLPAESENIFYEHFIDDHYPNRPEDPEQFESMSLFEFAKNFDVCNDAPPKLLQFYYLKNSDKFYCKKKKVSYLINHWKYKPENVSENYFYVLLLLFKPWRDIDELIGDNCSYAAAFKSESDKYPEMVAYHKKLMNNQELIEKMDAEIENAEKECENLSDNIPEDCIPRDLGNAIQDLNDFEENLVNEKESLSQHISELNDDQSRIFNNFTSCVESENGPCRMFMSGTAGTGKSKLIKTIVQWNKVHRNKDSGVTAPTGISAFNVNGLTLYRLLDNLYKKMA